MCTTFYDITILHHSGRNTEQCSKTVFKDIRRHSGIYCTPYIYSLNVRCVAFEALDVIRTFVTSRRHITVPPSTARRPHNTSKHRQWIHTNTYDMVHIHQCSFPLSLYTTHIFSIHTIVYKWWKCIALVTKCLAKRNRAKERKTIRSINFTGRPRTW